MERLFIARLEWDDVVRYSVVNCFRFDSSDPIFRYARFHSVTLAKFNGKVCTFLFDLCKLFLNFAPLFKI